MLTSASALRSAARGAARCTRRRSAPSNWYSASAAPQQQQSQTLRPEPGAPQPPVSSYTEDDAARDARIFARLRDEAEGLETSPLLGASVRKQILGTDDLASCLGEVLSCRLARSNDSFLPRDELRRACTDALRGDARVGADISAILARDPAAISYLQCIMFFKGFHATQAQRVSSIFWKSGDRADRHAALAIQNRISELWAVDVHPAAEIGGGLLMDHATGIVVGETAVIGDNCTILHAVTLGGTGKERGDRHPKIGHACVLGAGATILGNIKVGDGATVGSQAVVTKDVPPGMTVVGLNKLLDPHIDAKREKVVKKRTETWQYDVDTYDGYSI
jgi:serine O-acetyltransferase